MILENRDFLKLAQNHVFKGVWDDLEARIGISIQKKQKLAGSNHFLDGFEIFGGAPGAPGVKGKGNR